MNRYLVFQLRGDLASWGDVAVGEQRPSLWFPTKSAIIGLIAAALGIERKDEETQMAFAQAIQYAVAVDRPEQKVVGYNNEFFKGETYSGGYMQDYHTIQSASEPDLRQFQKIFGRSVKSRKDQVTALKMTGSEGTVLSYRAYRLDAAYIVAVCLKDELVWSLADLESALKEPKFHLYLGRKSCPVNLPLNPRIVPAETFRDAIQCPPPEGRPDEVQLRFPTMVAESGVSHNGLRSPSKEEYRISPRSRSRWQFDPVVVEIKQLQEEPYADFSSNISS